LRRGLRAADLRVGGGVRYLLGSAIEFLVEDSCVLCRRAHGSRRPPADASNHPAGALLEPLVLRGFWRGLAVRNRPLCASCAQKLVAARSAGQLGRRLGVWGVETRIGGVFGTPVRGDEEERDFHRAPAAGGGEAEEWIRILSPFMTTTPLLELVHLLKFRGYTGLAEPMGRAMAWAARNLAEYLSRTTLVVPVPMDDKSLRRRGFNAAELLARALAADLDFPVVNALQKKGKTRPQSKTPAEERAANVRVAFACSGLGGRGHAGAPVLLVDDLVTTGATAAACAAALLRAGAGSVTVTSFGRAM
jgi:ComF family protein